MTNPTDPRRAMPDQRTSKGTLESHRWPLWRKIDAWLEQNRRRRAAGDPAGPQSKAELARALGKGPTSITNWYPPACNFPGGRAAADLETLMGARLGYLLDEGMPWPPRLSLAEELVQGTLMGWTTDELDALALIQQDPSAMKELMRLMRRARREEL